MGSSLHGNTKGNVLQRVALEEVEMVLLGQFTYMEYERKGFKTKQQQQNFFKKSVKKRRRKEGGFSLLFFFFFFFFYRGSTVFRVKILYTINSWLIVYQNLVSLLAIRIRKRHYDRQFPGIKKIQE